jgi:hypothetical protein
VPVGGAAEVGRLIVDGLIAGGNEIPSRDVGVTGENDPQSEEHWNISAKQAPRAFPSFAHASQQVRGVQSAVMSHVVDVGSWPSQLAMSQVSALLRKQDVHVRISSEHVVAVEGSNGGNDTTEGMIAGAPGALTIDGNEGTDGKIAGAAGALTIDGNEGTDGKTAGAVGPPSDGNEATKGLVAVGWPKAMGFGESIKQHQ